MCQFRTIVCGPGHRFFRNTSPLAPMASSARPPAKPKLLPPPLPPPPPPLLPLLAPPLLLLLVPLGAFGRGRAKLDIL